MTLRVAHFSSRSFLAAVATVLTLVMSSLTPAQAISDTGVLDVSGITVPDLVSIENPQVSYDIDTQQSFICMTVYGLEDQQSATLADVEVAVVSDTVNDTFADTETYQVTGYDDGDGNIFGDLCVTVPSEAASLVDPVAFDSLSVSGNLTLDETSGGGDTGGESGGGSIGVVENGFDLSGITGPDGFSMIAPRVETDPDTGGVSMCMDLLGLSLDSFAYLRNVNVSIDYDLGPAEYPESQSYTLRAFDDGNGDTTAPVCLMVNEEIASVVSQAAFTTITISGDVFSPAISVEIDDSRETGVAVAPNFAANYDSESGYTDGCFEVTGLLPQTPIYLTEIAVTVTQNGEDFTANLDDQRFLVSDEDGDSGCLYVTTAEGQAADLGDLQMADAISLSAEAHFASTINASAITTYLSTKGVNLKDIDIARRGTGAVVVATMRPKLRKPIYLKPSTLKFGATTLTPLQRVWILSATEDTSLEFGYSATNFALDRPNTSVSAVLTSVLPSTVSITTMKLPKGLTFEAPTPADWAYMDSRPDEYNALYDGKTSPCLSIKNSTTRAFTLDLNWVWKIGSKRIASNGTHYVQIPAKDSYCVSGIEEWDPFLVTGDVRFGETISVTGTSSVVPATTLRMTITKPTGYTVTSNPAFWRYDPAANRTYVSLVVRGDGADSNDVIMSNVKINGTSVSVNPVAAVWGLESWQLVSWNVIVGSVRGDVRAGSTVTLSGRLALSDPLQIDVSSINLEADDYRVECRIKSPSTWAYSASAQNTLVAMHCVNTSKVAHTVNLSDLMVDYSQDLESFDSYSSISTRAVTIPRGTGPDAAVTINVFRLPGDVRTGGAMLTFSGDALFDSN